MVYCFEALSRRMRSKWTSGSALRVRASNTARERGTEMRSCSALALFLMLMPLAPSAGFSAEFNTETMQYMKGLEAQAKQQESAFAGFDPARGKKIFFEEHTNEKTGRISCATCHTSDLKNAGKTLVGKAIEPLAPSVNSKRLTSVKEIEKWLQRNFKQVYGREGTPREKGDVLVFINAQ